MFKKQSGFNVDRRGFLLGTGGALGSIAVAGLAAPKIALAGGVDGMVMQTVTGSLNAADVEKVMAHEHLYVDFYGLNADEYMDVNWSAALGASANAAQELRGQGVNLLIDWGNLSVGRNVLLLRHVTRQTGMNIVCSTGIYKSLVHRPWRIFQWRASQSISCAS